MVLIPRSECVISGSVALILRVSRYLGIAPVLFTKHRDGWTIQHSPALCLYGYTLITVVLIASIFAIILDYQVGLEHSVRMSTSKDRGIWIVDISSVLLCTSVAIYSAPKKMQRFTKYFGKLQRINEDLKLHRLPRDPGRMRLFFVITYFLAAIFITMIDFAYVVRNAYFEMKNMTVAGLYWFFYFCYIIIQVIQIQFVLNCWYVFNTFERISKGLSDLLMGKQTAGFSRPNIDKNISTKKDVPKRSLNNIIDTIAFTNKIHSEHTQIPPVQTTSEAIRRLAVSYSKTCDVVKEIDVTFGLTLLLLLGSILLHLVITPYNLITSTDDDLDDAQFSELYPSLCLELLWCVFHTSNLIIIVEPCHRTEREVENIKELVSKLMHSTTCERDLYELNLFYKHFFLNEIYYAPLKVCTLNRALVITIMSSILTYLVVLIQV